MSVVNRVFVGGVYDGQTCAVDEGLRVITKQKRQRMPVTSNYLNGSGECAVDEPEQTNYEIKKFIDGGVQLEVMAAESLSTIQVLYMLIQNYKGDK